MKFSPSILGGKIPLFLEETPHLPATNFFGLELGSFGFLSTSRCRGILFSVVFISLSCFILGTVEAVTFPSMHFGHEDSWAPSRDEYDYRSEMYSWCTCFCVCQDVKSIMTAQIRFVSFLVSFCISTCLIQNEPHEPFVESSFDGEHQRSTPSSPSILVRASHLDVPFLGPFSPGHSHASLCWDRNQRMCSWGAPAGRPSFEKSTVESWKFDNPRWSKFIQIHGDFGSEFFFKLFFRSSST